MCACVRVRERERGKRSNNETGTNVLNAGREMEKWPSSECNWVTAARWEEMERREEFLFATLFF